MTIDRRNNRSIENNNTIRSIIIGLIKKEFVGEQKDDTNAERVICMCVCVCVCVYDDERANAKPESHIRRLEGKVNP